MHVRPLARSAAPIRLSSEVSLEVLHASVQRIRLGLFDVRVALIPADREAVIGACVCMFM
jgi:hypothetical protein